MTIKAYKVYVKDHRQGRSGHGHTKSSTSTIHILYAVVVVPLQPLKTLLALSWGRSKGGCCVFRFTIITITATTEQLTVR